jgi:DinB superfamily
LQYLSIEIFVEHALRVARFRPHALSLQRKFIGGANMKRTLAFVLVFCALAATSFAQKKNPVTTVIKEIMPRQQKNLQGAVETMPADKFSFKPTEPQMTFGHLMSHVIESNYYLCAKAADLPRPKVEEAKETDKDGLLAALTASFDFCNTSLAKVDDSKLGDEIEAYGGRKVPRAWALIALTNDWADHYAAAATYLRLNGLLPPTAQPKK